MPALTRRGILSAATGIAEILALPYWAAAQPAPGAQPGNTAHATGEMPFVDQFGPVGTNDDTAAFNAAARSGAPFQLRARTYRLAGPLPVFSALFVMRGVPGVSRVLCTGLAAGPWFRIVATGVIDVDGVIWDGNGVATGTGVGMVTVEGTPMSCSFRRCAFLHGSCPAGLLISMAAQGGDDVYIDLDRIESAFHPGSGIWLEHGVNARMTGLRVHDNKAAGLRLVRYDTRSGVPMQRITVRDSYAWKNGGTGFSMGTYNEAPGGQPEILGPNLPDDVDVNLTGLFAWNNAGYGIGAGGRNVRVVGCRTSHNGEPFGGIVTGGLQSVIQDCEVSDEGGFGIDTGGSYGVDISRCRIFRNKVAAINAGGSYLTTGADNQIVGCPGTAINIANTEFGGNGWFQYRMNHFHFINTTIDISDQVRGSAIEVRDGAQDVHFSGLEIISEASQSHATVFGAERVLHAVTDTIRIDGVRFNGADRLEVGAAAGGILTIPDIAETVVLPSGRQTLTRVQTGTMAQVGNGIGWIAVTETGRGYDPHATTATLVGDGDVAAVGKLVPDVWTGGGGRLIGFRVGAPGRGFTHASVQLGGPGSGARTNVVIGVPIPRERKLRLIFPGGGSMGGELPTLTVKPDGVVDIIEFRGKWIVASTG